jgi:glyoxylase-like metal-dependent hydrolase (beta-lactamase superfamily II)
MRERRLPAGDDPLPSLSWQPVAGAPQASIYPLIRKIDIISSNSYLIATPDVILVIDPGGLSEQGALLSRVITDCREEDDRPVFVFLTHSHVDHFLGVQAHPSFASPETVVFAVHEEGARALENGDRTITQADLLGQPFSPITIGLHLFTGERADMPGIPGSLCFSNGATITIMSDQAPQGLPHERIQFGTGPALDLYHTPGHSPDSICLAIGNLLFCGDLLFAANPGLAGVTGWSQEALIHSLSSLEHLIATRGITLVCPGHGRIITAKDAIRMFSQVRTEALTLSDIAELNRERAAATAEFAEDCMEQVNELFTIMAGRLAYVTYILDELGEAGMAEEASALISGDTIDELLEAFRDFSREYQQKSSSPVPLMLKAAQVMGKLERTFQQKELAGIIDPTMVRRAARLLADYITMLRGFTLPCEQADYDLVPVIEAIITGLSVPPLSDEEILSGPDDEGDFPRILLSRIGTRPLLEEMECGIVAKTPSVRALIDPGHFTDLVTYILEDLVGTGAGRIAVRTEQGASAAKVTITGDLPGSPQERRTWQFLRGLAERAGGTLVIRENEGLQSFEFTARVP